MVLTDEQVNRDDLDYRQRCLGQDGWVGVVLRGDEAEL